MSGSDALPPLCIVTPSAPEDAGRLAGPIDERMPGAAIGDFAQRSLRVAIAMRGGVSLAVWIGGVVAEFDIARAVRAYRVLPPLGEAWTLHDDLAPDDVFGVLYWPDAAPPADVILRAQTYALRLARRGFHRLDPDVLAGASAGGLNAVLFAAAQREGRSTLGTRALWKESGAIAALLRAPGWRAVPSVLDGGYFFAQLDRVLRADGAARHPHLIQDHVTVDLSATILDGQDAGQQSLRDGRGGFHFRGGDKEELFARTPGGGWAVDASASNDQIPPFEASAATRVRARRRLALAARTTSSFPGAFESVQISSSEGTSAFDESGGDAPAHPIDYWSGIDESGSFVAHQPPTDLWGQGVFRVVDGGVLDNIPIERAIRCIGPRASSHPTERALVYLDPSPPRDPSTPPKDRARDGAILSVISSVRRRQRPGEQEARDVTAMLDHVDDLYRAEGRLCALTDVGVPAWADAACAFRRAAYVRDRAPRDAILIGKVLDDPSAWQLTAAISERRAWSAPTTQTRWFEGFRWELNERFDEKSSTGDRDAVCGDARAVIDAAACALAAIRFVESMVIYTDDGHIVDALLDRDAIAQWRVHAYGALTTALAAVDLRLWALLSTATAEAAALAAGDDIPSPRESVVDWADAVDVPNVDQAWTLLEGIWTSLRPLLADIDALFAPALPGAVLNIDPPVIVPDGPAAVRWRQRPWRHTVGCTDVRDLAPYLAPAGIPAIESYPSYARIDADTRLAADAAGPRLSAALVKLQAWHREQVIARALAEAVPSAGTSGSAGRQLRAQKVLSSLADDSLPAQAKLGGASIANFGGFLSEHWRMSDWRWGQIDGAVGIDRILGGTDSSGLATAIAEPGDDSLDAGIGGIRRLRGNYRYGIASTLVRVAERTLRGWSAALAALLHTVYVVVRPALLLLPLAVDLPRLLAMAAVLVTAVSVVAIGDAGPPEWRVAVIVAAAVAVVIVAAATAIGADARARWIAVGEAATEIGIDVGAYRTSIRSIVFGFLLAAVAIAATALFAASGAFAPAILWGIVSAALGGQAIARFRAVRTGLLTRERRGIAWIPVAAAVAAAVLLALHILGVAHPMITTVAAWRERDVWIVAFFVLGLILTARWLNAFAAIALPLLATVLLALAVVGFEGIGLGGLGWWVGITVWGNLLWVVPQVFRVPLAASALDQTLLPLRA
ncbi:DUF3376 domain-containing protein [Planococcus sp. APC 4015]|nr:DUF3376 domain-containing protein [Planococcus sp. APC 4015]